MLLLCRVMRARGSSYVHQRVITGGCVSQKGGGGASQAYSSCTRHNNCIQQGPLLNEKKKLFLVKPTKCFTLKRRCFFLGAPEPRRTTNVVQVPGLSPETMHGVVKDVARYEDFLPFCSASTVTEVKQDTSGGSFVGRLTVEYGGVYNESYSSQVVHQDPMWVRSEALDSPSFSELVSEWHFKPYVAVSSGITGCEVSCELKFQASSVLIDQLIKDNVGRILESQLEAFVKRAKAREKKNEKEERRMLKGQPNHKKADGKNPSMSLKKDLHEQDTDWKRQEREAEAQSWQPS